MSYDPAFQLRIYEMLMESQYWSPEQMRSYQEQQLVQLLQFARDKVPFYQSRLAKVLNADGTISPEHWAEVPALTRAHLLNNREEMLPAELPPGHGYVGDHMSSGTTGNPVPSRHNSLMPVVSNAGLFRCFNWHGIDYTKAFCSIETDDPKLGIWPEGTETQSWGPSWEAASAQGRSYMLNVDVSPENTLEFLLRKKISYISSRPSRIHALAMAAEHNAVALKFGAMIGLGESISENIRADCIRALGANMIGLYASKEVYNIAHQCNLCSQYHINAEMLLVEMLKENGEPAKTGEIGRMVVTSFFNTAQPFIRYELGDLVMVGDNSACPRRLLAIAQVMGRTKHLFRLPGGRKVSLSVPVRYMGNLAARTWQIAQTGELAIEVRYIPDGSGRKPDFDFIRNLVVTRTDERVVVTFKQISEVPLTPSGKFIEVVCELPSA